MLIVLHTDSDYARNCQCPWVTPHSRQHKLSMGDTTQQAAHNQIKQYYEVDYLGRPRQQTMFSFKGLLNAAPYTHSTSAHPPSSM